MIYCKQSFLDASNSTFLIPKGTLSLHANILFEIFSLNNFKVLGIMPQLTQIFVMKIAFERRIAFFIHPVYWGYLSMVFYGSWKDIVSSFICALFPSTSSDFTRLGPISP